MQRLWLQILHGMPLPSGNYENEIMNPEDQNKAICQAIEKEYHKPTEAELASGSYYQYEPDFTTDLNLMAQVESTLKTYDQIREYCSHLEKIVCRVHSGLFLHPWVEIRASAAQKSEAFLRTLGLWTDTDPGAGGMMRG
jgi:hypothetical protein